MNDTLLTQEQRQFLTGLGEALMGSAAETLKQLIGREVSIKSLDTGLFQGDDSVGEMLTCDVTFIKGLQGNSILTMPQRDAKAMAGIVLETEAQEGEEESLEEGELAALQEVFNQMIQGAVPSLSALVGTEVGVFPPSLDVQTLQEAVWGLEKTGEQAEYLQISFGIEIEGLPEIAISLLLSHDIEHYTESGEESRETLVEGLSDETSMNTETRSQANTVGENPADQNGAGGSFRFEYLKDTHLKVSVILGRTEMSMGQVLALGKGSLIELDRLDGEFVDILVNGKLVAQGEVVVVGEQFGVQIRKFAEESQSERLA